MRIEEHLVADDVEGDEGQSQGGNGGLGQARTDMSIGCTPCCWT